MKEVNSIFKIITLLICICVISHHNVNAQCVVVDQGPAAAPTCNYQSVSGGAGAYWEINTSAGVYYSFYWNGSGCPSNTNQFCINGLGSTATGGAPYNVQSGGGSWNRHRRGATLRPARPYLPDRGRARLRREPATRLPEA